MLNDLVMFVYGISKILAFHFILLKAIQNCKAERYEKAELMIFIAVLIGGYYLFNVIFHWNYLSITSILVLIFSVYISVLEYRSVFKIEKIYGKHDCTPRSLIIILLFAIICSFISAIIVYICI